MTLIPEDPAHARGVPANVQPIRARRAPPAPAPLDPDGQVSWLREYVGVIGGERRLVAAIAVTILVVGGAYAWLATPIYRADLLVQVEDKKKGGALGELPTLFSEASPAETEVEILRSRTLVGSVVDALKLNVGAAPRRFPVLGGALSRGHAGEDPAGALPGFRRFGSTTGRWSPPAWSGRSCGETASRSTSPSCARARGRSSSSVRRRARRWSLPSSGTSGSSSAERRPASSSSRWTDPTPPGSARSSTRSRRPTCARTWIGGA